MQVSGVIPPGAALGGGSGREWLICPGPAGNVADREGDGPSVLPLGGSEDLAVTVRWERDGTGLRGYVILQPGQRAAPVGWSNWCGQQASARAQVSWQG